MTIFQKNVAFSKKCDKIKLVIYMFYTNEAIKFMMAKIFFTLAEFRYQTMTEIFPSHYHGIDTIEIHYIKSGSGKVILENETYDIKAGSYYVIPPFVAHTQIPNENDPLVKYSLYFSVDKTRGFKIFLPLLEKTFIGNNKNLLENFETLLFEFNNKDLGYNEMAVSQFKIIIIKLMRNERINKERLSSWKLNNLQFQIENIMHQNFQNITLNDLANELHMSTRELQRYLKQNYNKTFNTLKTEARMSYASNQLLYFDTSIGEIAINCGYSTLEHFSYAFKKYFNISPLKYKKEKLKK